MKRTMIAIGVALAWAVGAFAATHEGVQLWENGPLWAKTNIGANSPTETGYYFWWGDTLGYKWQNSQWVASDGSVSGYSFSSTTSGKTIAQLQSMGAVGADGNLLPAYDAAAQQWGDDWRVPKKSEYKNLMELCTWTWTTNNNVVGYTVTGKGLYSGNSVFFPVTGYGQGATTNGIWNIWMWSSTADGNTSYRTSWSSTSRGGASNTGRSNGYPIRPVKSMSAAKAASAAALDTRTGDRLVTGTESIAYDTAWGGASSGTLKVNGSLVSGLSSKGTYLWTVNTTTATTNRWQLTYTAGTANYSATFWTPLKYNIKFNANGGSGSMAQLSCTQGQSATLTANTFTRAGHVFLGWMTSANGTTVAYKDGQSVQNLINQHNGTVNLYAKWTDRWYVDAESGDDTNEGASENEPFKTIQHAIDVAEAGQKVIVADGTYAPINSGNKSITIQSANGAEATIIDGGGAAICAVLGTNPATPSLTNTVLRGFTLQNGYAAVDGGGALGGTLCECLVVSNQAERCGGGVSLAKLANCVIVGNRALGGNGGGLYSSSADNCTIVGNYASGDGGGAFADISDVVNNNCIVFGNTATREPNISSTVTKHSCFTGNPHFVDAANGDFRLMGDSPCIDMGNNRYVSGKTDIRGNARIQNGVVDLGAYEFTLPTGLGNVPVEGTDAAVPVEWLGLYGCVDEDSTPASLQTIMAQVGDNGLPLWQSWVAGLNPLVPDSQLQANIEIVDEEVVVTWTPDLSDAEPKRHYTTMGKTNLMDTAWVIPVNEEHRFFKVAVTMGEPGLSRDIAVTPGTSGGEVSVSWRAVDWAVGYNVYRSTVDSFSQATLVASVTGTEYVDATAVPGTRYYYWIVSVANGGEWVTNESASGQLEIGEPKNVKASDGTSAEWITVTWNAVEGAVSYRVLRATTGVAADAVEVGTSVGTSWTDLDAASGVTYTYWVVAEGASFSSEMSASDTGYLRLAAPGGVTATNGGFADRVDVSWDAVAGATHYRVYRSTASSGSKTAVSDWQTELAYSDTTAEAGETYYYFVAAAANGEGVGASGYSAGAVGSRKVGVPTGLYATDGTLTTGVALSWSAVAGASGYAVYRWTSNTPDEAQVVASTANASLDDTSAEPGALYFYWVAATNAVSESAKSTVETGFRSIAAPTGVTATTTSGAAAVTISWQPVVGAVAYRVYRGTKSGEDFAVDIDTTTATTYADESVVANRTYYYSVKAVGTSCESAFSAFVAGSR